MQENKPATALSITRIALGGSGTALPADTVGNDAAERPETARFGTLMPRLLRQMA
jgi:hypothetical protein